MSSRKKSSDKQARKTQSGPSASPAFRFREPAAAALVAIAVFFVYYPAINGGFILDDNKLLTENEIIKAPDGLYRFWCTTQSQDYWPVTNTTLWIEWRLWGIRPAGYHITNLILHIAESLLIWIVLKKLSIPGAFLAAMLFAVHPVNVESVAWISQRKNTMAMLFFLLSILCYLMFLARARVPLAAKHSPAPIVWYLLSLAAFLIAMLSKGSVAVLPILLLGIIWWLRPITRLDLALIAPFLLVAAALTWVNMWFQTHGTDKMLRDADFTEHLLGAGGVVWFYLYKAIFPVDLDFVYPQWHIHSDMFIWWLPLLSASAVTTVLWLYKDRWSRPLLFAWGYFCVALAPVMGFAYVGFMRYSLVADHYQHIAIIGVLALASALWSVWRQRLEGTNYRITTAVAVVAVGALAFLTWRQCEIYKDAITLYQITLNDNPEFSLGHYNLGKELFDAGRLQDAINHYKKALELKPDYAQAHNNLGVALVKVGLPQEAVTHNEKAVQINPDFPEGHYNLGNAYKAVGRDRQAIEQYEQALAMNPDYLEAHNNLAVTLGRTGRTQEAIEHLNQALKIKPDDPDAHYNMGNALLQAARPQDAIEHYRQTLQLNPAHAEANINMGVALFQIGRAREAVDYYKKSIQLNPNYAHAWNNLAVAYASLSQSSEAMAAAHKALELARSQGQAALVKQIDVWINTYQSQRTPSGND